MAWQTECTEILRVLLSDLSTTNPTYSDDSLQRTLIVAAMQVAVEMTFSQPFTVDIEGLNITPDPTDDVNQTRDDSFVNLITIKAAAILERGEARLASTRGIVVRDGGSTVDLRSQLTGKLALLKQGWNAVYDRAKFEYMAGQVRTAGAAIMTPFRIFAGYTSVGTFPFEGRSVYNPFSI